MTATITRVGAAEDVPTLPPLDPGWRGVNLLADRPGWHDLALCAQVDPELFFPEKGGTPATAKKVCQRCEVKDECLEWALAHDDGYGIWGGKSVKERKAIRIQRKRGGGRG